MRIGVMVFLMSVVMSVAPSAQAQQDVGLVSAVSGDVTYQSSTGIAAKVQAFMRVREGDRIRLPAGAQIRVVFLNSSRQERWLGGAEFQAGRDAGVPIAGKPAEVTQLPAGAGQHMTRIPALVHNAKLGGIQLRGGIPHRPTAEQQDAAVREARRNYEQLRQAMPADDITPEWYLCSILSEYSLFADMKDVVADMLRRQPGNEDAVALERWVASKLPKR